MSPACTSWVAAFGAFDDLVSRSHACDYPKHVNKLPAATSVARESACSQHIADMPSNRSELGTAIFEIDLDRLAALEPDIILMQPDNTVVAVPIQELASEVARRSGRRPCVYSAQPATFKQVLNDALRLGATIGRTREAMEFLAAREHRLRILRDRLGISKDTPSESLPAILCVDWLDPIMAAGYWVPDMIELAGGRILAAESGKPSRCLDWEDVRQSDPDVLAVFPRRLALGATRTELPLLAERPGWGDLKAVKSGRVVVFDGKRYFNEPAPDLYRSIELLALALHSARPGYRVEEWEMEVVRTASMPGA